MQGDYAASRPLLEQALAIRKEVLGERHALYAASLNNLAEVLQAQEIMSPPDPCLRRHWRSKKTCTANSTPITPSHSIIWQARFDKETTRPQGDSSNERWR